MVVTCTDVNLIENSEGTTDGTSFELNGKWISKYFANFDAIVFKIMETARGKCLKK